METSVTALARRIAADVVRAAEQYPAVRSCRSFSELHAAYDVNESIIHALERVEYTAKQFAEVNAATAIVDEFLEADGFDGLVAFSRRNG